MAEYRIDNYAVRQWSSRSASQGNSGVAIAGIYLYEGKRRRGHIYFYSDETKLNPPIHRSTEEQILLNFNLSQFEGTLTMLAGSAELLLFYRSSTDAGLLALRQSVNGLIGTPVSTETV